MLSCWPILGYLLLLSATISRATRTHDAKIPAKLPPPSKTMVHQRTRAPTVSFRAEKQDAPVIGKTTKTVVHQKEPGNGYKPGSPLYNVQEGKETAPSPTKKAAEPQNATRKEKLYACVDHVLDHETNKAFHKLSPQEITEGTDECIRKYDATPMEAWGIRERAMKAIFKHHFWTVLVTGVLLFIFTLLAAFVYQRNKKDPDPSRRGMGMDSSDFKFGICSCFEVPGMSLLTCCCFAIRWADTMRMASFLSFWVGVILITSLELINSFTGGLALCVAWGIVVYYRQQLRKEFGLEHGTAKSCCCDICGYCWIPCCMAVQEARQLEEAYAVGHPIRKVYSSR